MKVLAVVPDAKIFDILANLARYNPALEWHVLTVRPDADTQPGEWTTERFSLGFTDRVVVPEPAPFPSDWSGNEEIVAYARACTLMQSPELKWHFSYNWDALAEESAVLYERAIQGADECDVVVTWGHVWLLHQVKMVGSKAIEPE